MIESAVKYGKALELNASPMRLDLSEIHLIAAAGAGVPIAINTDAHSIDGMDAIRFGVQQARRACLLRDQVLNTWSLEKLMKWLQH